MTLPWHRMRQRRAHQPWEPIDQSVVVSGLSPAAINGHRSCSWIVTVYVSLCASVRVSFVQRPELPIRAGHPRLRTDSQPKSTLTGVLSRWARPAGRAARRVASAL